ncbi:hypothetical protein ACFE04_029628 [Oxalis oulophora]
MAVCAPISTSVRDVAMNFSVRTGGSNIRAVVFRSGEGHPNSRCCSLPSKSLSFSSNGVNLRGVYKQGDNFCELAVKGSQRRNYGVSLVCQRISMRLEVANQLPSKIKCSMGPVSWSQGYSSVGLVSGLIVCCSCSEYANAESAGDNCGDSSNAKLSHGKKVYTDYSITGIPGDGRCLFRSVAHGACLRLGKPAPSDNLQRELADELRAMVADEFIKRRGESEWFVEGDFDTYVSKIRQPHVWGGEPELFMASHVLQLPITVYMHDKEAGGLISIAEYGQEYGGNPIRVLYHGFGHYDALQIPGWRAGKSKL